MQAAATATVPSEVDAAPAGPASASALAVRFHATTDAIRRGVTDALARLRVALDLPSRTEVLALATRLEAIEARLATLAEPEAEAEAGDDRRRGRGRRG
ncbi:MAG: hypothetical protein R3B06_30075 [Kofleriaceae bacterium]